MKALWKLSDESFQSTWGHSRAISIHTKSSNMSTFFQGMPGSTLVLVIRLSFSQPFIASQRIASLGAWFTAASTSSHSSQPLTVASQQSSNCLTGPWPGRASNGIGSVDAASLLRIPPPWACCMVTSRLQLLDGCVCCVCLTHFDSIWCKGLMVWGKLKGLDPALESLPWRRIQTTCCDFLSPSSRNFKLACCWMLFNTYRVWISSFLRPRGCQPINLTTSFNIALQDWNESASNCSSITADILGRTAGTFSISPTV